MPVSSRPMPPVRVAPPAPTPGQIDQAYRTLAAAYAHNYPGPNKERDWAEHLAEATGCFEEDEEVGDELYAAVLVHLRTL